MRHHVNLNVSTVNYSNVANTHNGAKTVFSLENQTIIFNLFNLLEDQLTQAEQSLPANEAQKVNSCITLLDFLRKQIPLDEFDDLKDPEETTSIKPLQIERKTYTTTAIATELGLTAAGLNKRLYLKGVIFKPSKMWLLQKEYQNKGLEVFYTTGNGIKYSNTSMVWTEKGRKLILSLFIDQLI